MKMFLLLFLTCLALQNAQGAPTRAVYKFVKCNPEDNQANCVTHQTSQIPWNAALPRKLPASDAENLNAKPIDEENPIRKKEMQMEEPGSGGFEGSGETWPPQFSEPNSDSGIGESWMDTTDYNVNEDKLGPTQQDLKEDHLMSL